MMTLEKAFSMAKTYPEPKQQKVINYVMSIKVEKPKEQPEKPFRRQLGTMADKITYVAPDFDSCFEDDPAAFGLEEYM